MNQPPSKPPCKPVKPTREEVNAKARARYWADPEKARQSCHRYARTHREDVNRRVRAWQLRQDPAAFRALQRRYYATARARKLQATLPESRAPAPAGARESAATLAG